MRLHEIAPAEGARRSPKRVGRGPGSGHGKTASRGEKGARSRSGYSRRPGFEGGQMPLARRIPKRGFHNLFGKEYEVVNVSRLADFGEGAEIAPDTLYGKGVIPKRGLKALKVLGNGEINVKLSVKAHAFSKSAREKIEKAGVTVEVIGG